MTSKNAEVTKFLDEMNHPFRTEIEKLREIILKSASGISENIKWNGPNYLFEDQDRITMRIQTPKKIQVIFHRGAKKLNQPKSKLIDDAHGILEWKENDRAIATFTNMTEINRDESHFKKIVDNWIKAAK